MSGKILDASSPGDGQALWSLIKEATRAQSIITAIPGGTMRISRPSGRQPYEMLVAPMPRNTFLPVLAKSTSIIFLRDPEAQNVMPLARLQYLYGLTRAEARLMTAMLRGNTLDMVAKRFNVSKETLRSQLKSLFQKTCTKSQLELLRLGLRVVATFKT